MSSIYSRDYCTEREAHMVVEETERRRGLPSDDIDLALDAALSIEEDAVRDGAAHAHGDMAHADAADAAAAGADQAVALATELGRYDARVQLLLAFADASVDSLDDRLRRLLLSARALLTTISSATPSSDSDVQPDWDTVWATLPELRSKMRTLDHWAGAAATPRQHPLGPASSAPDLSF